MLLYFSMIAIVSLFCLGLRAITDVGMIGFPLRSYFLKNAPTIGKPIILCSTCMSSFWGTIIFWSNAINLNMPFSGASISMWIGISISSAFVNAIFWEYYQNINSCKN